MSLFHKHLFKLKGNSLYCECGNIKHLPCCHKWDVHSEQGIIVFGNKQTVQTLICKNCGQIKNFNLTTGI